MNLDSIMVEVKKLMFLSIHDKIAVCAYEDYKAIVHTECEYIPEQQENMEKAGYEWLKSWLDTGASYTIKVENLWQVIEWRPDSPDAAREYNPVYVPHPSEEMM